MQNKLLLNPMEFVIDEEAHEEMEIDGSVYCKRLMEKWTPELETEMLEAFIRLYYDEMYIQWGPDDEEENKAFWPELKSPADLIKYVGTDVCIYALEDAIYARNKTGNFPPYESQNVPVCVILSLDCPWDLNDPGWAAVFVDEKLVKVDRDIVDCVYLD